MSQSNENIAPSVVMAVAKELRKLTNEPLEGIKVLLNEEDITNIVADIAGPVATPFHSGTFKVKLVLPSDYPASPPKGYFLTKIYHPNISKAGEICVNTLKRDWKQDVGVGHVLQVVRCLLINPFPESALNEEAGKLFMEDYDQYFKKAAMMTEVHARVAGAAGAAGTSATGEGGPVEKRQKPIETKEAEKRRQEKKKSIKRL
ncbi:hypothetical protein EMIHUDRAFT_370211 [Emiliania huxleyi CCMP1516]|uniref:E2 ubiquitin-conjugating enzyme n=2 Tax=Emiliania huxleyi TaxID=2903 RepID=A0A0D3IZP9_EMIH1|nr:hypothetical protein EMIHUDRAFT_370211 [Emiliania huxleyi CCMP1516]EOD16734.1 hypothetical protein EMIHUDRAFT_370211 [Emiliania huxleyi CCMP1516]|mmetsp:Transcript_38224/g.113588  ORF Transcript_38224/g.113588 Transcript_38224/m.113588 type:complete len:203 (+) Transcript_38224:49-657(+)|eukprot:XP_005769163.1 hypothetical protein EMIHUDRAFT_370211 [Emiliania huxleyi CCMP1516]